MEVQGYYTLKETTRGKRYYDGIDITLIVREAFENGVERLQDYLRRFQTLLNTKDGRKLVVLVEGCVFCLRVETACVQLNLHVDDYMDPQLKSVDFFEQFCRHIPPERFRSPTFKPFTNILRTETGR